MTLEEELLNDSPIFGTELEFELNSVNDAIGEELYIYFTETMTEGDEVSIRITYNTLADGQAFSWLTASQTAGGSYPYLFTQCEDIDCRAVAPLQDTPSNRITYSARVIADSPLVSRMSANLTYEGTYDATRNQAQF